MTQASLLVGGRVSAEERLEPAAKDATVFGHRLHYLEAGRGDPVILLHGTGGEGARWMPNIKGLAPSFRVIALDQIGFGQSDKPLTMYHSGVFAGFLAGFMQAIGVQRATIIGQSMGAAAALYLAIVSWCLYRWRIGCRKTRRIHTAVAWRNQRPRVT